MKLDFSKWAVVAHNDDTGFGRMARDICKVLGLGRHIVIPSERLQDWPVQGVEEVKLAPDASEDRVAEALAGLQGIIFFERLTWSKHLLAMAGKLGVASVCVPMWEWFTGWDAKWNEVTLIACPNHFAEKIVRAFGFAHATVLPWTIDLEQFPARTIEGQARVFVHNAGLVDANDRKGTSDTINAFRRVRQSDVKLIVRMQKEAQLPKLDERIEVRVGNVANASELYGEGDVAIQPSRMEGLGFMVLEPVCAGMPVITTDYPPMSEWVRQPELRCTLKWFKRRAFGTQWIKHAHLRLPRIADLARRIEWCAENDLGAISSSNRAWALETFAAARTRSLWAAAIEQAIGSGERRAIANG